MIPSSVIPLGKKYKNNANDQRATILQYYIVLVMNV